MQLSTMAATSAARDTSPATASQMPPSASIIRLVSSALARTTRACSTKPAPLYLRADRSCFPPDGRWPRPVRTRPAEIFRYVIPCRACSAPPEPSKWVRVRASPNVIRRRRNEQREVYGDGAKSARIRGGPRVARYHFGRRAGSCPKVGRRTENLPPGQSGQHVDPRRGDQFDRDPDDGRLQQSCPVAAGRAAEQPAIDRPGSGHRLVVERGWHRTDIPVARGRQMARRPTLYRQ